MQQDNAAHWTPPPPPKASPSPHHPPLLLHCNPFLDGVRSIVWSGLTQTDAFRRERLQRRAARLMTDSRDCESNERTHAPPGKSRINSSIPTAPGRAGTIRALVSQRLHAGPPYRNLYPLGHKIQPLYIPPQLIFSLTSC